MNSDEDQSYREIADYLDELSELQGDLLGYLRDKHNLLSQGNPGGLANLGDLEKSLVERLRNCQIRRGQLLSNAGVSNDPQSTISTLVEQMGNQDHFQLRDRISGVSKQAYQVQQQMLSQWVVMQRTLIHLSHLLEIIATGGRPRPTYGKGESARASGSLVDQAI